MSGRTPTFPHVIHSDSSQTWGDSIDPFHLGYRHIGGEEYVGSINRLHIEYVDLCTNAASLSSM